MASQSTTRPKRGKVIQLGGPAKADQRDMFHDQKLETKADRIERLRKHANGDCYFEDWAADARAALSSHDHLTGEVVRLQAALDLVDSYAKTPQDYLDVQASLWEAQKRAERAEAKLRPGWYAKQIGVLAFGLAALILSLVVLFQAV